MSTAATKLTYDDYAALPEDGKRYELIEGELYVNASPLTKHQAVQRVLLNDLANYVDEHDPQSLVYGAPYDVVLSAENVFQPDILYVSAARASIVTDANVQGAPDLVVEILSDSTRRRDEVDKRRLYEQFGVAEYWLADPMIDRITVYRRSGDGKFERVAELSAAHRDVLESPLFPGLRIELQRVFVPR